MMVTALGETPRRSSSTAKGVTARVGSSFETYSVAYQFLWFD